MNVKELFDKAPNGVLNFEEFKAAAEANNAKFVDLSEGGYVSKGKYESELEAKTKEIETLNGTVSTRDTDLEALRKQLEEAGTDATKLSDLTSQFETLKGKYDADTKAYKEQLKKQEYEFAVREFAATKNFSSKAAKRDFIQSMTAKGLKMENGSIIGADDFVKLYTENNSDAFMEELGDDDIPDSLKPQFVSTTPGAEGAAPADPTAGFLNAMHFTPVRSMPEH